MKEFNKIINFDEFKEKEVPLDNIYLDPNNPRFFVNGRIVSDTKLLKTMCKNPVSKRFNNSI